jgi:hypothetical protein
MEPDDQSHARMLTPHIAAEMRYRRLLKRCGVRRLIFFGLGSGYGALAPSGKAGMPERMHRDEDATQFVGTYSLLRC